MGNLKAAWSRWLAVALGAVLLAQGAPAQSDDEKSVVILPDGKASITVPLKFGEDVAFVALKINGKDAGLFIIDTASAATLIDATTAIELGLPAVGRANIQRFGTRIKAQVRQVESLSIGDAVIKPRVVLAANLAAMSKRLGFKFGGFLGLDILRRLPVTIDYRAQALTLHDPLAFKPPAGVAATPLKLINGWPAVDVTFSKQETGPFRINTGIVSTMDISPGFIADHPSLIRDRKLIRLGTSTSKNISASMSGNAGPLIMFGAKVEDVNADFLMPGMDADDYDQAFAGAIGAGLLKRFVITYDLKHEKVYAQRMRQMPLTDRIAAGLDVNKQDLYGATPLFMAARDGDVEGVAALLKAGAKVDEQTHYGATALYAAAGRGNAQIVDALIKAKADPNAAQKSGTTALMLASRAYPEVVRLLISGKAKVDATDQAGQTALHYAAQNGQVAIVDILIAAGADPKAVVENGQTTLIKAALSGNADIMKRFLAAGVDPKATDQGGQNALMAAAASGSLEAVKLMLDKKIDINAQARNGRTALSIACFSGHGQIVDELLKRGANPKLTSHGDRTMLMWAVSSGDADIVSRLIKADADVNATDIHEQTALYYAISRRKPDIVKLLLDNGAKADVVDKTKTRPVMSAAVLGELDIMKLLIERGADVNAPNLSGMTPLMLAARHGNLDCVNHLMSRKAGVNDTTDGNETALLYAATEGHTDVCKALLAAKARHTANAIGITPLIGAVAGRHEDTARALIDGGANVNHESQKGLTPLIVAVGQNNQEMAELLLASKADINHVNRGNITALDIAERANNQDMINFLKKHGAKTGNELAAAFPTIPNKSVAAL